MTLLEVAKHALEAMEDAMYRADTHEFYDAKESLRYAIEQAEQAEQEPVAWMDIDEHGQRHGLRYYSDGNRDEVPLYTAPTPRKPEQKLWCDCGDSIEPDSGAKCGNCVAGDSAEPEQEPVNKYCCHACFNKSGQFFLDRMILCPECGNKRCPKASHHDLPCTNSNEPGQEGSIYTAPTPRKPVELTDEEIALIVGECAASAHRHDDFSFARSVIAAYEKKQGEQT